MTFIDIAAPLARMGVPITPVRPGTKRAFLPDFPTTATTDYAQLAAWNEAFSDCNAACVARAEEGGVWFWEVDAPEVLARIQKDTGHDPLTEIRTFRVRSRPGRGHFYFRHNALSLSLGNISQTYVVGQDWSVRTNREYVVAPGSIHPDTGKPYEALNWDLPIIEAPEWLVGWLLSQKIQKFSAPQGATAPTDAPRNERGLVPHGSIHGYMLREAGKLRQMGLDQPEIEVSLLALVNKNCEPPIDEAKVVQMSKSICNFPAGEGSGGLVFNQQPAQAAAVEPPQPAEDISYDEAKYPVFPKWVMWGTSVYEGFVKPYCEKNSRVDYFMWMPTAAMMLNYIGNKVSVDLKGWKPSIYLVLVGERGRANKSSSIKDGMKYLEFASVLQMYGKESKNADGKSYVWEAGSPEGLGTDMQRTNCKNAILFYDELSALVSKAGIEGSGMNSTLLKMYESANFSNSIKSKKDTFSVAPDSYVATLITATTDKKFTELWSKLAGEDTGLNDRFTFVLQPQVLPEVKLQEVVSYHEAALETRKLIDKAVQQGKFAFDDQTPFREALNIYKDNRIVARAEKWALYFAVDSGLTSIDEECVAKGLALAKYEMEVKDFLNPYEAKNDESNIQQSIIRLLKRNKGSMAYRELEKGLNGIRYGMTIWKRALASLVDMDVISVGGRGVKGSPQMVVLLRDVHIGNE